MAKVVFLHVGTMKSGTTYLQRRLYENRAALAEQGVLFWGEKWSDQKLAVGDLLQRERLGGGVARRDGMWSQLVEEVSHWPGPAVVSMELLGTASPAQVDQTVKSFGDTEVHVLITARDLNRAIPAMWQESLQNGETHTWEDYLVGVRAGDGPGKRFWRHQDTARMAKTWSRLVGPERVTVVTVPPPGAAPELLWERFSSAVGFPPESCSPIPAANESLGAVSSLVMRRLNHLLSERGLPWRDYNAVVKRVLAKSVLSDRRREEPSLGLSVLPEVTSRSREIRRSLVDLGVNVVGDLDDLEPVPVEGVDPGSISAEAQLEAAVAGLAGLIEHQRKNRG